MTGIYKITSPSGKIYIGQSINIEERFKRYVILSCKSQTILYNSLKYYSPKKHKFEVIHELPKDIGEGIIERYERIYYDFYVDVGFKMMNICIPGEKGAGKHSQKTKDLLSSLKSKIKITQFTKEGKFIKVWNSVYEASKSLNIHQDNIRTIIANISKTAGGFVFKRGEIFNDIEPVKRKKCTKRIIVNGRSFIPLYQYDLQGNLVKEWRNKSVASEKLGIYRGRLSGKRNKGNKPYNGFIWSNVKL